MQDQEINEMLNKALEAYKAGYPVVVLDCAEHVLHGEEFLKGLIALEMPMRAAVFKGVPREYFEVSDWPEILEAARQVFFSENPDCKESP